jgi:hypothetical protein
VIEVTESNFPDVPALPRDELERRRHELESQGLSWQDISPELAERVVRILGTGR